MAAIDSYLKRLVENGGSDLHFLAGDPPRIRVNGDLKPLENDVLQPAMAKEMLEEILSATARKALDDHDGADPAEQIRRLGYSARVHSVLDGDVLQPPLLLLSRAAAARTQGMAGIADQICTNTLSARSRDTSPAAVAFVRESILRQPPEGYARNCEALAKAQAIDGRRIKAPVLVVAGAAKVLEPRDTAGALRAMGLPGGDRVVRAGGVVEVVVVSPLPAGPHHQPLPVFAPLSNN